MGNFYPICQLSSILNNLHHDCKWKWTKDCQKAFQQVKNLLASSKVLVHYNPAVPIKLAADASAYGVGAVISHILPNGNEKPIASASRTLTPTE